MQPRLRYHQMLASPHVGGGARLAIAIHRHIVSTRGPVAQLLLPGGAEAERVARSAGYAYTEYAVDRLTGSGRVYSGCENWHLLRSLSRHGEGIIHIHAPFVYGAASPFLRWSRLKTVLHVHLDFTVSQLSWALRHPPDLIFVCANFMRAAVESALPPSGKAKTQIIVALNAIDTQTFTPVEKTSARMRLGVAADEPLLAVIANLAPHKGQDTAIRSVAALKNLGHRVRLWIVGGERTDSESQLSRLKSISAELRVADQVDFLGFRKDVADILRAADFLMLPSTSEGLPLVILEAHATKTVVLAAPTAGIPEIIKNGLTGFLIDASDHASYAATIAHLLTTPGATAAVADAALKQVRSDHDIQGYCQRVLSEYDELL